VDRLNDLAPAIVGAGIFAFAWFTLLRIKREQAKAREKRQAAE
jgi:preprotein translocase subunit YajC